jgi:hypothetical protein
VPFVTVLLICAFGSAVFAGCALLIALKAGVALQGSTQPALTIGFKGFSLSAGSALVALFVCSLLCLTVVPITLLNVNSRLEDLEHPMVLEVNFSPPVPLNVTSTDDIPGTHDVKLRIFKSTEPQGFLVSYPGYSDVIIKTQYDWVNHRLVAEVNGKEEPVNILGDTGRLSHVFELPAATVKAQLSVPAALSTAAPIARSLQLKGDPVEALKP